MATEFTDEVQRAECADASTDNGPSNCNYYKMAGTWLGRRTADGTARLFAVNWLGNAALDAGVIIVVVGLVLRCVFWLAFPNYAGERRQMKEAIIGELELCSPQDTIDLQKRVAERGYKGGVGPYYGCLNDLVKEGVVALERTEETFEYSGQPYVRNKTFVTLLPSGRSRRRGVSANTATERLQPTPGFQAEAAAAEDDLVVSR